MDTPAATGQLDGEPEPAASEWSFEDGALEAEAAARGIADGQRVRVFNDRGATVLPAKVPDRITPGVVSIRAWFTPDERGDDGRAAPMS